MEGTVDGSFIEGTLDRTVIAWNCRWYFNKYTVAVNNWRNRDIRQKVLHPSCYTGTEYCIEQSTAAAKHPFQEEGKVHISQ